MAHTSRERAIIEAYVAAEREHRARRTDETLAALRRATDVARAAAVLGDSVAECILGRGK